MSAPDVVVVGAGTIGLAVAWRTAQSGLDVAVVDEAPGRGSTWAAAGMLAPVTEVHYGEEELLRINLESADRYPDFVAELEDVTGSDVGYRQCGTLAVARDRDDNEALEDLYRFQQSLGLKTTRLKGRECREMEPGLAPTIRGGIFVEGDHSIDNRALAEALLEACKRTGVSIVAGRVDSLLLEGDRVSGVALGDGNSIPSARVVLAAGCWTGSIGGLPPEATIPVRPVKGQLLYLDGSPEPPLVSRNVRGLDIYIVPRGDGRVVIGATVEELGFDSRVTANGVYSLLRDAYELIPGILELELTEPVAGLRPGTPDNAPLVGATVVEGLFLAVGHYRNGILLTPTTADSMAELLVKGVAPELIEPFSPARFQRSTA